MSSAGDITRDDRSSNAANTPFMLGSQGIELEDEKAHKFQNKMDLNCERLRRSKMTTVVLSFQTKLATQETKASLCGAPVGLVN